MTRSAIEPLELLRKLADDFRHLEQEHGRQPQRSSTRRRLGSALQDIEVRFERLLAEWVRDDGPRAQWRDYMHGRAAAPDTPRRPAPPLFKGRTDAGAVIEIRKALAGHDLFVDGAFIDHSGVPWRLDPDMLGTTQIGDHACEETFDAPPAAVTALAEFLAGRATPPWRWARELIDDGLVNTELALTPRGQRSLRRGRPTPAPPPRAHNVCVLVADAARARVLVLDVARGNLDFATSKLVEVADTTNPMLRARDAEVLSDSRPGLRREGPKSPRHAVSDHREDRRRDIERHFAARVAEEAASVWRRYSPCELIVAASPVMLGLLRPAIERQIRAKDQIVVRDLARDLTKLTASQLQDLLAEAGLLPRRGRRPPQLSTPGLPL